MWSATLKVLLGGLNVVTDQVQSPAPGLPFMLTRHSLRKRKQEENLSVRKILFRLWEVISTDCFFLYKLVFHLFTCTFSNIFTECVLCAGPGTEHLGSDGEWDTVSALNTELGHGMDSFFQNSGRFWESIQLSETWGLIGQLGQDGNPVVWNGLVPTYGANKSVGRYKGWQFVFRSFQKVSFPCSDRALLPCQLGSQ